MQRQQAGLTLIEVMVTLVIVGILSAIALPSYNAYVTRGRLAEAFSTLASAQPNLEQYWNNTRSYAGFDMSTAATPNFTYALSNATNSTYLITATGRAQAADFIFTIDQAGVRKTTGVPSGWTTNDTCWVDRKGGVCTQ